MNRLISLTLSLALIPFLVAAQVDGRALMVEGNELFRDGLYRAALLRYREASAAGLDTPLLHYNLGVASYKVERYDDAEVALERASSDPRIAPLALYNLGLTSQAKGETLAAERWFRLALERADRRELRQLSESALQSVTATATASSDTRTARRFITTDKRVGEFNFLALARVGQDDNIYRSPAEPYNDLSQPGAPLVTPLVQSGSFMPLDLLAEYVLFNEAGDTNFHFTYVLNGDFYGSEFSNANQVSQRFELGSEIDIGRRKNIDIHSAFFIRDHQETNFDPDDGIERDINGVDISERFSYGAAGIKGDFEHTIGRWTWGFDMRFERRQYDDSQQVVANYDHELYFMRGGAELAVTDSTRVYLGGRYYRRFYDERGSRDANGDLLAGNPPLRYKYRGVQIGMEHDVGRLFRLEFDYLRLDRMDQFAGYYDYDQHVYRLGTTFRPTPRFRISIAALAREYEYSQAFAYNDPVGGLKELEDVNAEIIAEFRVTPRLAVWLELLTEDIVSNDARAAYTRSQSMIGVKWRQ